MFAVLSDLWFRWTDQGSHLCWFRRNEAGGNFLQHSAPPVCRPALWDGSLPETDQLAHRRVGTGEPDGEQRTHKQYRDNLCAVLMSFCAFSQTDFIGHNLSPFASSALRAVAPAHESGRWSAQTKRGTCTLWTNVTPTPNPPQWSAATPSPATAHRVSTCNMSS